MRLSILLLCIILPFSSIFAQQTLLADSNDFVITDSVLIPTRSGIDISAVIVHNKKSQTPLPAILFYTTYYQGKSDIYFAKVSAEKNYIGILAYARGIRTDLDYYFPYEHEASDVNDIIDWISKQTWCNGSVGMYGGSYTGFSQWAAVKKAHPALKTIVPQVAVMPGFDVPMENNVQLNMGLYWPNDNIYKRKPIRRSLPFEWFENGYSFRSLDTLAGFSDNIFQRWLQHPDYDDYWQSMVPTKEEYARLNIPVLTTTGYYDGSQISALQYYKLHTLYNNNVNHYVVIGPYDHWGAQRKPSKILKGYTIDTVAHVNMMDLAYQWFDYILKGKEKPSILKDKINYQVMGTNLWYHSPSLSEMNNDTITLYLHNTDLTTIKPTFPSNRTQTVNFADRKSENNFFAASIIADSINTGNGLVFTSAPFAEDFSIQGSFFGNLIAMINKKDMDISLALYELMPDGKYFYLTRYLGRASYTNDNSQRHLLTPNKEETIPINNTRLVCKHISKGSRLIVLLNINKHPFEIINYGTGKNVCDETIQDALNPLNILWSNRSHIKIPIKRNN